MDNIASREVFVKKVLETIPSHLNPAEYLMEILDISKVSVYRRINCKIPFTYDEIVKLSSELNFSLDEIICSDSNNRAIFMVQNEEKVQSHDFFLKALKGYYDNLLAESIAFYRKATIAINNVWLIHTMGSDNLFKFYYYKWLVESSPSYFNHVFEEITVPYEILELKTKIGYLMQNISNNTFIIDKLIYFNTIRDIQYYYRRKLLSDNDLFLVKKDLENMITYTEEQVAKGTYTTIAHYFYLSYVNIYTNSLYVEFDDKYQSFFYEYSIRPLRSVSPQICEPHKRWMESLMKNSVFITASNEALQVEFFNKQKEYLRALIEDEDLIP